MKIKSGKTQAAAALAAAFCTLTVRADGIGNSVFGRGIKNLVTDVGNYLVVLSPLVGGAAVGYFFIRRGMADQQDGKMWQDRAKIAAICGVGGMLGGALISLISGYFV